MPSPYLCERFHPTRGCVSPNFRPETTFSKVAGRVRTVDLQTRRLPLNPLLHGGLTGKYVNIPGFKTSTKATEYVTVCHQRLVRTNRERKYANLPGFSSCFCVLSFTTLKNKLCHKSQHIYQNSKLLAILQNWFS